MFYHLPVDPWPHTKKKAKWLQKLDTPVRCAGGFDCRLPDFEAKLITSRDVNSDSCRLRCPEGLITFHHLSFENFPLNKGTSAFLDFEVLISDHIGSTWQVTPSKQDPHSELETKLYGWYVNEIHFSPSVRILEHFDKVIHSTSLFFSTKLKNWR